jgi:hypothetical protein
MLVSLFAYAKGVSFIKHYSYKKQKETQLFGRILLLVVKDFDLQFIYLIIDSLMIDRKW